MRISQPVIITTADARARHQHKRIPRIRPAICTTYQQSFYVRCIPIWGVLTEGAVTESTAENVAENPLPGIQTLI